MNLDGEEGGKGGEVPLFGGVTLGGIRISAGGVGSDAPTGPSDEFLATASIERTRKSRREVRATRDVRRGLRRALALVVDLSDAMQHSDLRPNRVRCAADACATLCSEFFDANPVSQMCVIAARSGLAERLTSLSSPPTSHANALRRSLECHGACSFENAVLAARSALRHAPRAASKECVMVLGALHTQDPGDLAAAIAGARAEGVRISVVGLAAEVHALAQVAVGTGGTYAVAMSEAHLTELVRAHVIPPATAAIEVPKSAKAGAADPGAAAAGSAATRAQGGTELVMPAGSLMRVGFPALTNNESFPSLCSDPNRGVRFTTSGHRCPRCRAKYSELPVTCSACGLYMASWGHLVKTYHNIFPIPEFEPVPAGRVAECYSCLAAIPPSNPSRECSECGKTFCGSCDDIIHEFLHVCPGCEAG